MSVRTSHRLAAMAAPVVAAGLLLGACGGSGGGGAESTPTISLDTGTTNYQTVPPATTIADVEGTDAEETTTSAPYTIQSGDVPVNVANKFNVSVEDIANLNGWGTCTATSCPEWPFPGEEIQIPGGVPVTEAADPVVTPAPETGAGETGESIDAVGDNCEAGSHTVVAGDIPLKLVELYDVTLEDLNAANANNPAYQRFIPGDKIVIPAKDGC